MALVKPFRALRPDSKFAAQVAAPPYDVVSLGEARQIAEGNPNCFLRIGRAELELADGTNPYSDEVYAHGAANLQRLIKEGWLIQESKPLFGVYRQRWGNHKQTGLVALASIDEYDRGIIKKHELTRPMKENDRVRIIEAHESQSGPVLLFFHRTARFQNWLRDIINTRPDTQFMAEDGVEHTVWSMRDPDLIQQTMSDFQTVKALYIADGHHRSAAASRVRAAQSQVKIDSVNRPAEGFLVVIFPHDELQILPYNRLVQDLNGHTPQQFLETLALRYDLQSTSQPGQAPEGGFDMYLEGQWQRATPRPLKDQQTRLEKDPVSALAVSVLTERVLDPLLGIKDQRSDPRIDFVGGVRPPKELEAKVDSGEWAVAFWLYPTTLEELMAVSDAEQIMPPKSTWFEPKLRDGLFVHMLRDA